MYLDAAKKKEIFEKYGKSNTDTVYAHSEADARKTFKEIYRYTEYRILAAVKL